MEVRYEIQAQAEKEIGGIKGKLLLKLKEGWGSFTFILRPFFITMEGEEDNLRKWFTLPSDIQNHIKSKMWEIYEHLKEDYNEVYYKGLIIDESQEDVDTEN